MSSLCFGQQNQVQNASDANDHWLTGAQLRAHVSNPISASLTDAPLKSHLTQFSNKQKVALFIDRRIDPSTPITLSLRNVTIEQFFWEVAKQGSCGVCQIGDLYYFGPPETAAALPLAWEEMKSTTRESARRYQVEWSNFDTLQLAELTDPHVALQELAQKNGFQITGQSLPHDLWSSVSLPSSPLDQRVAILLVGFELWMKRNRDGKEVELIPFPTIESGKLDFGLVEDAREMRDGLRNRFPDCKISTNKNSLQAKGSPKELAEIKAMIVMAQQTDAIEEGDKRFTLNTNSPRGSILATIAQQMDNQLEFAPELEPLLKEQIEISVKNVTLNQLLEKVLDGTGVGYEIADGKLMIGK